MEKKIKKAKNKILLFDGSELIYENLMILIFYFFIFFVIKYCNDEIGIIKV